MTPTPRLALLALLATTTACQAGPPPPAVPAAGRAEADAQKAKDRAWQRMKDCAQQADRAARREKWFEGAPMKPYVSTGYTNHYSPKYDRCYALVTFLNHEAGSKLPLTQELLFDAFEARVLATCTSTEVAAAFCSIEVSPEKMGNCQACEAYVKDRMDN
jgi:hypothetical protein